MSIRTLLGTVAVSALLVAGTQAADVVVEEVVVAPVAAPVSTWDGVFVGIHTGWGWTDTTVGRTGPGPDFSIGSDPSGVLGGLQIGYNYQYNQFVFGVVGDISATGMQNTSTFFGPINTISFETDYEYIATIRGRAGWLWNNTTLLYAHGGVAFTDVTTAFTGGGPINGLTFGGNETGWVAGAGVEAKVSDKVSIFAEYSYIDFDSDISALVGPRTFTVDNDAINAVKIGVNFKLWNPGN